MNKLHPDFGRGVIAYILRKCIVAPEPCKERLELKPDSIEVSEYGDGSVRVKGLTANEVQIILGALKNGGGHWVRVVNGRLVYHSVHEPLPDPVTDEGLLPFWRTVPQQERVAQTTLTNPIDRPQKEKYYTDPTIIITSLCGYHYSPENYQRQAALLTSYGFMCLRSQRDQSNHYHEQWVLHGAWAAKGNLEKALAESGKETPNEQLEVMLEYLRLHVQFGSLDVTTQRLAMVAD